LTIKYLPFNRERKVKRMQKVFISRQLPGRALARAAKMLALDIWEGEIPPSREVLTAKAAEMDGLLVLLTDFVDAELLAEAPNLKVVSNYAVGFDNIDVAACTARGISVGNTPDVLTETTADLTFALLMAAARRIVNGADICRRGEFKAWSPTLLLGEDIHGASLGIVGMGRIGRAVARRARGFGMTVRFTAGNTPLPDEIEGATQTDFETLIAVSDFVSLHVPLNDHTQGLIDGTALSRMKREAVLINTARGPVVDQDALYNALNRKEIAYAAMDVTTPEPLPAAHPLFTLDNCLIIPHLGSASKKTRERMAEMAVDNLLAGVEGRPLPNCVNPEVYK
jgi:glyoxylate reductase